MKSGKGKDLRGLRLIDEDGDIFFDKTWCTYSPAGFWTYKDVPKGQQIVGFQCAASADGKDIGLLSFLLSAINAPNTPLHQQ
jgi:hypothetical protein